MRPTNPSPEPRGRRSRRVLTLAAAAVAALSIVATAGTASVNHRLKLDTTMFAAQIGTTGRGGSVYAGALVDPRLGHGATVFSTNGASSVRVIFHEYFALGSINGSGTAKLVPGSGGQAQFSGSLNVTGGTAKYDHARGNLTTAGTSNSSGTMHATVNGSVSY